MNDQSHPTYDVAVIGAGFGGMATALRLAERGARVALFERLTYPGGCASTFQRKGYRFESGATLFCGFDQGQLFHDWIEKYDMDVTFQPMEPVVEIRTSQFTLPIPRQRDDFIDQFCAMEGAPAGRLRSFFEWQEKVADALWDLFDDPSLLPPFSASNLLRHIGRSPRYIPLLRAVGRTLGDILERFDLHHYRPLTAYLDAVCQITVQLPAREAEAPFALAAMDYFFRGSGHIQGGIGELATAMTDTIERLEGDVFFADPVWKLRREDGRWRVESRRREIYADQVVANLIPRNLADVLGGTPSDWPVLRDLDEQVEGGWGAAMLYLGCDAESFDDSHAFHLELIDDLDRPFQEGNHIFISVGGEDEPERAPEGQRVATVSTHVNMSRLWNDDAAGQAQYIDAIQQAMRRTLATRAPKVDQSIVFDMTASPRTFERFTNRHQGYVGGIPRRAGIQNYLQMGPVEVEKGLWMVGDTVFPGQSTLAVALGGLRVADTII